MNRFDIAATLLAHADNLTSEALAFHDPTDGSLSYCPVGALLVQSGHTVDELSGREYRGFPFRDEATHPDHASLFRTLEERYDLTPEDVRSLAHTVETGSFHPFNVALTWLYRGSRSS